MLLYQLQEEFWMPVASALYFSKQYIVGLMISVVSISLHNYALSLFELLEKILKCRRYTNNLAVNYIIVYIYLTKTHTDAFNDDLAIFIRR